MHQQHCRHLWRDPRALYLVSRLLDLSFPTPFAQHPVTTWSNIKHLYQDSENLVYCPHCFLLTLAPHLHQLRDHDDLPPGAPPILAARAWLLPALLASPPIVKRSAK